MRRLASIPEADQRPRPQLPVFWMAMAYACDRCGFELGFYLEEGLEGPRDKKGPVPQAIIDEWPGFLEKGPPEDCDYTAADRVVLPVPFVASGCPVCQSTPPWSLAKGCLQHVRWDEDRVLDPRVVGVPQVRLLYVTNTSILAPAPHFRYPTKLDRNACGIPNVFWAPRSEVEREPEPRT